MHGIIDIAAALISISALFAYINHRFIGLPTTIGVMIVAMLASLLVYLLSAFGLSDFENEAAELLGGIDFNQTLLNGMLSFLLFAGALHVSISDLNKQRWIILSLATFGVVISTFLVATAVYYLLSALSCHLPYQYCLLFGALISPTDPIAVMSTVKRLGVSKELETTIAGESLFNDGVGVVVFTVLLLLLQSPDQITAGHVLFVFAEEAIGGISIAVVVAGLITGSLLRKNSMSEKTRRRIDDFWELIDEILNVILFALIGLEMLIIPFESEWLIAGLLLILIVVLVRVVSVGVPIRLIGLRTKVAPHLVKILVWGGLRGGISVALALSLPDGEFRDLIVFLTYIIVVFSIVVQGLTIGPFIRKLTAEQA